MRIVNLLKSMEKHNASDLFLCAGKSPLFRVMREVQQAQNEQALSNEDFRSFITKNFPEGIFERFQQVRDLDLGLSLSDTERFRLNLFYQKGSPAIAARRVPSGALSFQELNIPPIARELAECSRGLVLITGATGSGKSTTMAAMLHHINSNFSRHIVTIEDPVEYIHRDCKGLVSQREVGADTLSFAEALKHVVRQNPDVIFIGEMRDLDTIQTAVSAAMTGHLVITTLHTVDVAQTIERILNYFPDGTREQAALDFSLALSGILSQRLVRRKDGNGVAPVFETLKATPLVRKVIAERDLELITDIMKAGAAEGMQTFARSLVKLCNNDLVDADVAKAAASNNEEFMLLLQGMETGIDTLRIHEATKTDFRSDMKNLLHSAVKHGASDLHLSVGSAPLLRINGNICETDMPALAAFDTQKLLFSVLTPRQRGRFEKEKEIDFALSITGLDNDEPVISRFRVNGFYEKGSVAAAFRIISQEIPTPEQLRLPPVIMNLASKPHGLILITGPTGHGKSTTLACLINRINETRSCHIITVEDPIEFVHQNKESIIQQREVHADTMSFASALKYVLRQDPDVILIGEMRDQETMGAALTAAETGHLVFATLHTNDAVQTIDRIIDSFPSHHQNQIRMQLASCLEGIIAQRLIPKADNKGRIAAFEIMLGNPPIRALIRDSRTHQVQSTIETSAKDGMVTMDKSLQNLYNANLISRKTLLSLCKHVPGMTM